MEGGSRRKPLDTKRMEVVVVLMMMMVPLAATQNSLNVRLQNGTETSFYRTGRVQLYDVSDNRWKSLCSDHDTDAAVAVCRMLGFQKGAVADSSFYGNGTDPFYPGWFLCGAETDSLQDCTDVPIDTSRCGAAGVICYNDTNQVVTLRLVDGSSDDKIKIQTGRLEARMADLGWGSVCYYKFDQDDADQSCKILGYKHGEWVVSNWKPGSSQTQRYQMSGKFCILDDCGYEISPAVTCNSDELTALRCINASVRLQTTQQNVLNAGRVEVLVPGHGWWEVCDQGWNNTSAYVVCKELGFVDGEALCCNQLGGNAWDSRALSGLALTGVRCTAQDTRLVDCHRETAGSSLCPGDQDKRASVVCFTKPRELVDQGFKARLRHNGEDTTAEGWGRVQVEYKGFWGDVCPETFTRNESTVACRMLGFNGGGRVHGYGTAGLMAPDSSWTRVPSKAHRPVWISSVACFGNETSLDQCAVSSWGAPDTYSCEGGGYVICYRNELNLTLVSPTLHYGLLQVERDTVTGKVCGQDFEDFDASVACQTLGYFGGKVMKGDVGSAVNGPAYLSDVKCRRGDSNLFNCDSAWRDPAAACDLNTQQAAVSCFNDIELRFGTNHRSGLVVMYNNKTRQELGKICSSSFSDLDAKVICQQIGFPNGYALPPGVYGRDGKRYNKLASQLNGLNCAGTESGVWSCPKNVSSGSGCVAYTSNYASVSCFQSEISQEKYKLDKGAVEGNQEAGQVNVFYKQTWGFVCQTYWTDAAAKVLCKHQGYAGGVAYYYPGYYSGPYFVTNVTCQGSELALEGCSSASDVCSDNLAAGVLCHNNPADGSAPRVALVQDGKVEGRGRVSIQVDGEDGRVCGQKWTDSDAKVVCRALNYQDGIALTFPRSNKPVVMFDVACTGRENSLFQCVNPGWRRQRSATCSGSSHTEAGVMCFTNVKLTRGQSTATTLSGALQMNISMDQWSNVCDGISSKVALVACGQLGFTNGSVLTSGDAAPTDSLRGLAVKCVGNESRLSDCVSASSFCIKVARLVCFNTSADSSWEWGILNGSHGEVTVKHQGVSGSVCKYGWSDAEADTLCRQKGFKGGVAFGVEVKRVSPTQLMWLEKVSCPTGSQGMGGCTLNSSVSDRCKDISTKAAAVLCYNVSAPVLSLVGGSSSSEGRVQIQYDGVNGTVCDVAWGSNDAARFCRDLGFATGLRRTGSRFGGGSGRVYLSGVQCDPLSQEDDGSFLTCPNAGWLNSGPECRDHTRDAGALCYPSVKLSINSSLGVGAVQMIVDFSYRYVCSSGFDDNAANVVCRQLEFAAGKTLFAGAFGHSARMSMMYVNCRGSESRIEDCDSSEGACAASYAAVVCSRASTPSYNVKLESGNHGPVVVQYYDHNGYVCSNGYDNQDAIVVCKEAGFLTGFGYTSFTRTRLSDILWLDNVNCSGSESRLDQCRQGNRALAFGKYKAELGCNKAGAFCANTYDQATVAWRLTRNGMSSSSKGRVEVRINGTWGAVCSRNFDENEVDVLCRQLGYASGRVVDETFGQSDRKPPVWVTDLQCLGKETSLLDCQLTLGNHRDNCIKDAAAACNSGVRLKQTSSDDLRPSYGVLEIIQVQNSATVGRWNAVCADNFNNHTADIVCRELDYQGGVYQNYTANYVEQMYFGAANVTCSSQDNMYTDCQKNFSQNSREGCPGDGYVYLFCYPQRTIPDEALSVTLDDSTGPVTVSRYGFKGAVCGEDFNDTEAKVVCKAAGYVNGFAVKALRSSKLPFVLSMLSCAGSEQNININQCSRGSFVTSMPSCPSGTVAHVLCTESTDPVKYRVYPEGDGRGRAEVRVDTAWELVDGYGFTSTEAIVFCKGAGFKSGVKLYYYSSSSSLPARPYAVERLNCYGNETSLLQCDGNWNVGEVGVFRNAYVKCSHSVRLKYGTTSANGMLEYNRFGRWGAVCGVGFDDNDAAVVCRELGYDHGKSYSCCTPHGSYYYFTYVMAKVQCRGTESSLGDCLHSTAYADTRGCSRYNYASVACYNANDTKDYNISFGGDLDYQGPVQLTYLNTEGRICSDSWDDVDARVACRELGFRSGQAYNHYRSRYRYYSGPFWASNFQCTGNETRLQDCPHTGFGNVTECKNRHMAGALCYDTSGLAFRMVGNRTNAGRVEIRVRGKWGTICSYDMSRASSKVFCRSQGFVDGIKDNSVIDDLPVATGPIYSTYLYCRGTEENLNECAHEGWEESDSYLCSDQETDASGVFCYANVKLSTSRGVSHGAVRLYQNGTWNFTSDDGFDDVTARAVCRELGYEDGRAICCSAYTGSVYYSNSVISTSLFLHCDGDEATLADCVQEGVDLSGLYPSVICLEKGHSYNNTVYKVDLKTEDSQAEGSGRLKVEYLGVTGRICAEGWTDTEATVFCKTKGYNYGMAYFHSDKNEYLDHEDIGPYLLSSFNCTGNETDLLDCPHSDRLSLGNCTSGHAAGVACYSDSGVQYKLGGGTNNSGRVDMAVDGIWGTVCDDEWDDLDADVFCRSINFTSGEAISNRDFQEGQGTMWLTDVQCKGTEDFLHRCPHTGFFEEMEESGWWWYPAPCSDHDDDAAVRCYKNVRLSGGREGIGGLNIYYDKKWVAVCDDSFDNNAATIACQGLLMDYQYGVAIKGSAFDPIKEEIVVNSVHCVGNKSDIMDCDISTAGTCQSGHYVSVACSKTPFDVDDSQVRITNDSYSGHAWGIVEISKNGVWRRICHQGWDSTDAAVTCKQMGFKGGVSYTHIYYHRRPISFRNFTCTGAEKTLQDCPHQTTPDLDQCGFSDYDAGVLCYNSTGISYELGGNNATAGRVELVYDGEKGAVCDTYWSYNDSSVFCRSLGFSDGLPIDHDEFVDPPRELNSYFLNAAFCRGTEKTLLDCLTSGFNSTYLGRSCRDEAYVNCYNVTFSITNIRLVLKDGSPGQDEGRLEVFVSGPDEWGTVCDDYWDDYDASVACVQLGFVWGEAVTNQTHGSGTGRIWLDNVECNGTETTLDDCIHRGYGTHNCWHTEDAGVVCYNTPKPTLPTTTSTTTVTTTSSKPPATTPPPTTTTRPPTTTAAKPITTTPAPSTTTTLPTTTPPIVPSPSTQPPTTTTLTSTESAEQQGQNIVPIAVGVAVPLIIILIIVVVVVVVIVRRRRRPSIPHQRFSEDVIHGSNDGSISMHNQMYDGNMEDTSTSSMKRMAGGGEITLGGDSAVYTPDQPRNGVSTDSGFANPLYSVMQPFRAEGTTLPDEKGQAGGDSNEA